MKNRKIWKAVKVLSIIGVALASYLLLYEFAAPEDVGVDICYVTISPYQGLPCSLVGLIICVVIYALSVLRKKKFLLATSAFGIFFCLGITYPSLFLLGPFEAVCHLCIACQAIMLSVFLLALYLNFQKTTEKTSQ